MYFPAHVLLPWHGNNRHHRSHVSDVQIHDHRNLILCQQIGYCPVMINPECFFSETHRPSDQKSLHMRKPSGLFHLPDGTADGHHMQITGFQKPEKSILFIPLLKFFYVIKARTEKVYQTIHTSADQSSLHCNIFGSLWKYFQFHRLRHMIRRQRMFFIFDRFFLPQIIIMHTGNLSAEQIQCVLHGRMPRFHSKRGCARCKQLPYPQSLQIRT